MLDTVLILAAAAAGVTGAWSPCGFSMVETLAPQGYAGRMRVTAAACVTFAAGALAGACIAIGDPALGLAVGLSFGAGRLLPVVALAPAGGGALHAAMAERPRTLRSLRAVDAVALTACAVALVA